MRSSAILDRGKIRLKRVSELRDRRNRRCYDLTNVDLGNLDRNLGTLLTSWTNWNTEREYRVEKVCRGKQDSIVQGPYTT